MEGNRQFIRLGLFSGAPKSGRKTLLLQYIHNQYMPDYEPTIDDVYKKRTTIGDINYVIEIEPIRNHEFTAMRELYIKSSDAIMLVYAVDSKEGFDSITSLYEEIYKFRDQKVPVMLVATKCDVKESKRKVTVEQGKELARRLEVPIIEVSARTNTNVAECFEGLVREMNELAARQTVKKKDKDKCIIC